MITRDFDLWITQGHTKRLVFNANQYDQGETWRFRILGADGNPIVPTTAAIIGQKKDGHAILVQGTVSDGKVVITETEQMTACAGLTEFELLLNGETHGTANFTVQVEKRPGDDADLSDSDLSLIQDAVDAAETIIDVIGDGDPSEVIGEHVDAWLDEHPEATTTVQDGAITAPKINQSLWDKLLVSEEASGAVASFDDGADDVPVSSLKVALEPIQTGSGDPSPSNVRPIIASNEKNLLQNTGTSKTENGITWTRNADGSVKSVGTSTGNSLFVVNTFNFESDKTYILTGCPSGGAISTKWQIQILADLSGSATKVETGTGETISGLSGQYYVRLVVRSGNTVDFTWYPMIRLAEITDPSYQPYQGIMVEQTGRNLYPIAIGRDAFNNNVGGTHTTDSDILTITCTTAASSGVFASQGSEIRKVIADRVGQTITYSYDIKASVNTDILIGYESTAYGRKSVTTEWQRIVQTGTVGATTAFVCYGGGTACTIQIKNFMFEMGSEAHEYEPFISNPYPYTLGQSVYGGTVNLATGVLTVDRVGVSLNDPTKWVNSTHTTVDFEYMVNFPDRKKTDDSYAGLICSYVPANNMQANYCRWYSASGNKFGIKTDGTLTLEQIKSDASAGNIFISYPLATPQTIQLTPTEVKTLLGYNNISSTGTVDVIYHADTKLYVDKMTAVDNNIIAPTEEGFTATRNYTTNDLVIVNDTLYKVTANIATGSAITPNSNVTQTTLGALIKALS